MIDAVLTADTLALVAATVALFAAGRRPMAGLASRAVLGAILVAGSGPESARPRQSGLVWPRGRADRAAGAYEIEQLLAERVSRSSPMGIACHAAVALTAHDRLVPAGVDAQSGPGPISPTRRRGARDACG